MQHLKYAIATLLLLIGVNVFASTSLSDIAFTELPGGKAEIVASFSQQPDEPTVYVIDQPARIVIDLPSVSSALPQKKYSLGLGNVKSVLALTASGRTRLILNLDRAAGYSSKIENNQLTVVVENPSVLGARPLKSDVKATNSNSLNEITAVDFRREKKKGAGNLLLSFAAPKIAVNVERQAGSINLSFLDTDVGENLQRRLDVVDFATPVRFIETRKKNNQVDISIKVDGDYDYLAYQTDNKYVVSVSPLTDEELAEKNAKFRFVGEKLSLNFQDIEVRKVLEIIADFTELNLVASDTVTGNITLRLENVPWDQALELVLKSKGLDKRQSGNVLLVAPAAEIAERERQELESRKQLRELEPLVSEFINIKYANASDILSLIKTENASDGLAKSMLSSRGGVIVDERTNSMIITDILSNIEGIKSLIDQIDVPVRQVMIEARIVSATDDFMQAFEFFVGADGTSSELTANADSDSIFPGPVGSALDISYVSGNISLALEIQALEESGYGEVISQPRVLTGDKQTAKISSGQQIPFTSSDGDTVTTIFQDALLSLEVTPQITPDNQIIMDLKINRDSLDTSIITISGSPINVTELTTTALVGDGDTIVLGGIYEQTKSSSTKKVPVLGDIPVIGRLFTSDSIEDDRTELLIFITPRILADTLIDE